MSNPPSLELEGPVVRAMVAHAESGASHEAVGLLGGRSFAGASVALQAVQLKNLGGADFFVADPYSQYIALQRIRRSGQEVVALYHSHAGGAPVLSPVDRLFAQRWACPHVVVTDDNPPPDRWRFTAWLVREADVVPVPIVLSGSASRTPQSSA